MRTCDPGTEARARGRLDGPSLSSTPPHPRASALFSSKGPGVERLALLAAVLVGSLLSGCAYYSFTGASIPSHLETIAVPIAQDNSTSPINTLGNDLTGELTNRFVDRTSLSLTTNDSEADALLEATVQQYTNRPTGVSGNEQATTNQVTIRVEVRYMDQKKNEEILNRTFSGVSEYNPAEAGLSGRRQASQNAIENVADDIFTTATSDW